MPADRLTRSGAPKPGVGIVHLGLGAFYRAFGAVYIADAMAASGGDWGITGVSLQRPDVRDALAPQGCAYTVVSLGPDGEDTRVIEVLDDVLVAPENPEAVLAAMADAGVQIVTLTVTEKGYCHNPATGALDAGNAGIQHDIANPLPKTAPGYLVRALQRRQQAGLRPFTVLTCDNLPENGRLVRGVVLELAALIDPALATWIRAKGRFPATMVDRITPATTDADIARIEALTGVHDAAPVLCEPFRQWVIEDDFVDGARPDFAAAGAEMVSDVTAYEHMKLRMLNGTHSALAYLGYLGGFETIADTVADPGFAGYVRALWAKEIAPAIAAPPGVSLSNYADALFDRYANPAIRHRTWQIAMDGSQKLPQRLLGTLQENLDDARPIAGLSLAVAAWMRYVGGVGENGQPIDVRDPMAGRLRALSQTNTDANARVKALLAVTEIFPPELANRLTDPVTEAYKNLLEMGARASVAAIKNLA